MSFSQVFYAVGCFETTDDSEEEVFEGYYEPGYTI